MAEEEKGKLVGGWRLLLLSLVVLVDEVEAGVMLVEGTRVLVPVVGGIGFRGLLLGRGVRLLNYMGDLSPRLDSLARFSFRFGSFLFPPLQPFASFLPHRILTMFL